MSKQIKNSQLMADARTALSTNWGTAIGGTLVYVVITSLLNLVSGGIGMLILAGPLSLGLVIFYANIARGKTATTSDLFEGFNDFVRALIAYLVILLVYTPITFILGLTMFVFVFYGFASDMNTLISPVEYFSVYFLLVVLTIPVMLYISLGLSQTMYLLMDNKELSGVDVVKESWKMMKGNKRNLLILWFRFLPWVILSVISFGIGFLFLIPYMGVTSVNFYDALCEERQGCRNDLLDHIVE